MRRSTLFFLVLLSTLGLTCARITVNIYFPAAEIRNAAEEIEQQVRQEPGAPAPEPATPAPGKGTWFWTLPRTLHVTLTASTAEAQSININIKTPAIDRIIASRKQRYSSLVPLFDQGALGENNRGFLEVRKEANLSLQDRARANTLSAQENQDRQQLYEELAKANNIPRDKVAEIGSIFADVNRRQARSQWWLQTSQGQWQQK